jgi:REP element-mobilizing transposase RayT
MTRDKLRFGCCYHLYYSGNPREAIFQLEKDYYSFLDSLRRYIGPIVNLYAYCLLPTHLHLLLRIKDKKKIEYVYSSDSMLGGQFENLFAAYSRYVKQTYHRSEFQIKDWSARELPWNKELICDLVAYIHQNPQIYSMVTDFRIWPFSSCYAHLRQDRRSMIAKELLLDPACHNRILNIQNETRQHVMEPDGEVYRRK